MDADLQREIEDAVRHATAKALDEQCERIRGMAAAAFLAGNNSAAEGLRELAKETRERAAAVRGGTPYPAAKGGAR